MSDKGKYYEELVERGRRALREGERDLSEREVEILRKMTPGERVEVSFGLYRTAWRMKEAGVRLAHPEWSQKQVEAAVREAFLYGQS